MGLHSIRKFASDIRGRWKGTGRVSDVYDDAELPYPDAKVAASILCGGGPCLYYQTNPAVDVAIMGSFILSHVVPNIRKRLLDSVCLVLGKALMWMTTSPFSDDYTPVEVKEKVLSDWAHVCVGNSELDAEQCAIFKNPLQNWQWWCRVILEQYLLTQLGSWRSRAKKVAEQVLLERLECRDHTQTIEIS